MPITLSIREPGPGDDGVRALEKICSSVCGALDGDRELLSSIGLSLYSHRIPLQAYILVSRALLGGGPRYVILDSLQMQQHIEPRVQEETDRNWSYLWRQRHLDSPLMPAYSAAIRTACSLLGDEAATAVLPVHGIQAPAGSAWLPIVLPLPRFADDSGRISWRQLDTALEGLIDLGNQLLDILSWPTDAQRFDAWLNRRLAVLISGTGDLVLKRGIDPGEFECLQWLDDVMLRIRKTLWTRSHVTAGQSELLPSLARSDLSGSLNNKSHRQTWRRQWHLALADSVVRNRNLLVMSPYSVLPKTGDVTTNFTDVLPVLSHADAYAFAGKPRLGGWNVSDFKKFHIRAWAIMQRGCSRSLVAARV